MRQCFDDILRVRVPASLAERLRTTASAYARSPSDVVREAVVLQLDRLARLNDNAPSQSQQAS